MSPRQLRCLHVGVGNRGSHILQLVQQRDDYQPVALQDVDVAFLAQARAVTGLPPAACHTDLDAALHTPGLDACIITSPARFHAHQMRAALDRGLHVFVAKPMTYDLREAEALVTVAEERGLTIVVDQQQRFSLTERTLADWVRAGRYGAPGYGSFTIHRHRPVVGAFTGDNPFVWEQGVHSFDSLRAILGRRAVAVQAHQITPAWSGYNGPTVAMGVIEFAGGVPIAYLGTFDSRQFAIDLRVEFEQAAVRVASTTWRKRLSVAEPGGSFTEAGVRDDQDAAPLERFSLDHFARAVQTGARVPNDGRDNLQTLAIVEAFIRSARDGRRLPVAAV